MGFLIKAAFIKTGSTGKVPLLLRERQPGTRPMLLLGLEIMWVKCLVMH